MAELAPPHVHIGISGWRYPPWRGVFYPPGLRIADELKLASTVFSTIELNGSFYSLQRPSSYANWYRATPREFVFAVKGGRYITHLKRLRDVKEALANFFASGLLNLREKMGPFLWQLPPRLTFDAEVLARFLELLPHDLRALETLARGHGPRLAGRAVVESAIPNRPVRHAIEVRHPSFLETRFVELLREHGVAPCVADSAQLYPYIEEVTADFVYVRLHGAERLYVSGYSPEALRAWAAKVEHFTGRGLDVYVYFDNDVKVHAPFDALNLRRLSVGLPVMEPRVDLSAIAEEPRTGWPEWAGAGLDVREARPLLAPAAMATRKTAKKSASKASSRKAGSRRYGDKASQKVEKAMHEMKRGKLRSGGSGEQVKSRKQAIAIGLSEARRAGGKVPAKKGKRSTKARRARSS